MKSYLEGLDEGHSLLILDHTPLDKQLPNLRIVNLFPLCIVRVFDDLDASILPLREIRSNIDPDCLGLLGVVRSLSTFTLVHLLQQGQFSISESLGSVAQVNAGVNSCPVNGLGVFGPESELNGSGLFENGGPDVFGEVGSDGENEESSNADPPLDEVVVHANI